MKAISFLVFLSLFGLTSCERVVRAIEVLNHPWLKKRSQARFFNGSEETQFVSTLGETRKAGCGKATPETISKMKQLPPLWDETEFGKFVDDTVLATQVIFPETRGKEDRDWSQEIGHYKLIKLLAPESSKTISETEKYAAGKKRFEEILMGDSLTYTEFKKLISKDAFPFIKDPTAIEAEFKRFSKLIYEGFCLKTTAVNDVSEISNQMVNGRLQKSLEMPSPLPAKPGAEADQAL